MLPTVLASIIEDVGGRWRDPSYGPRRIAVERTLDLGNRFTFEALAFAINQQARQLNAGRLLQWAGASAVREPVAVAVLNPGNVPFVELQDFLAVILVGHRYRGTLSTRSPSLLPAFAKDLIDHGAEFDATYSTRLPDWTGISSAILSGSDETVSHLRSLIADQRIPAVRLLLRGHHYSVAVIGRNERPDTYERLAEDILLHEGLGCRNVGLVWAPEDESPDALLSAMARFRAVFPGHPATAAGLKLPIAYCRAANQPHAVPDDDSFLLTRGEPEAQAPGHIRWSEYRNLDQVTAWLRHHGEEIQLVVATTAVAQNLDTAGAMSAPPGEAQRPRLGWPQGNPDVITFLRAL